MPTEDSHKDFVRLLTQHQRRVYSYILGLVPNWADADEILQETNVRLWEEWEKFEPGTDFGAWAVKVAYYQVLTHRKKISRSREMVSQEFVEAVATEFEASEDRAAARQAALVACFDEQPEANRELIRRSYAPGATTQKVADHFGRSVAATYKALARARKLLGDCILRRLKEEDR
ncbi:MAG: sigma-70 family RNA polymerase sigma factor [Pirellulales bacterium]|nr:sigma-70 family RNA polymerase sigma factor [Pirellulales bacterium]